MSQSIRRALFALVFTPFALFPLTAHASDACSTIPIPPGQGTEANDGFGTAVQWLGHDLAVGAPGLNVPAGGPGVGGVFIYRQQGTGWVESQLLLASDGASGDGFGVSLAASGSYLFVGAPNADAPGVSDAGAVYVFEKQGSTWVEIQKLSIPIRQSRFGSCVSAEGQRLVVGAPYEDEGEQDDTGAVYVYVQDTNGPWALDQRLSAPDAATGDSFGFSVALFGDRLAAGVPGDDDIAPDSGSVYVFEDSLFGWFLADKLVSPAPQVGARFGSSTGMHGDRLVVGEPWGDVPYTDAGRAFVFERDAVGSWPLDSELVPSAQSPSQGFGWTVAIEGDLAVVAAPGWDHPLFSNAGLARAFRWAGGSWVETTVLREGGPLVDHEHFGSAIDLQAGAILVGEPRDAASGEARGGAYVFPDADAPPGTELCFCDSGPCGNSYSVGGCRNFTGAGSWLHACGSASVALDDLVLVAEQVPAGQFGILYMGPALGATPFGDGVRCVFSGGGVGVFRYPVQFSGSEGVLSEGPGIVAFTHAAFPPAGRIQAGQTWYFQAWFRDPLGPCGSDFNLSNALEVTFVP